jgi:hypothetical protein
VGHAFTPVRIPGERVFDLQTLQFTITIIVTYSRYNKYPHDKYRAGLRTIEDLFKLSAFSIKQIHHLPFSPALIELMNR